LDWFSRYVLAWELSVTLDPDELDDGRLLGHLYGVLERLCRELRQQQRVCHRLTLTVRYSDQVEITRCQRLNAGTAWEAELSPHLTTLFARCVRRRVRVRMMTVGAEALALPDGQLLLFDEGSPSPSRARRLALALDRVHDRFGDHAIWHESAM